MLPTIAMMPEVVRDGDTFLELVHRLRQQPRIAVDTESNSLHAYREQVCLMQFSTPERDYVLDVLALPDVGPLGSVFSDPSIEKIFHAAEYDILCLRRDFGFSFSNIFDTMQAGRILGSRMAGLDRLIEEHFGIKVSKQLQKADWGARPLSQQLLEYAAQDTHYLIPLRDLLFGQLQERGLLELAQEDFRMACLNHADAVRESAEPPAWARLRARRDLTPRNLTVLKELIDWREGKAAILDRPPFKVLGDEKLIEIARACPTKHEELAAVGLSARQSRQWSADLLEAVSRGLQKPLIRRKRPASPSSAHLKRLEQLKEWRKKTAVAMDVESDVILPRGLLLALAEGGISEMKTVMEPSPWRLRRFGADISEILRKIPSQ